MCDMTLNYSLMTQNGVMSQKLRITERRMFIIKCFRKCTVCKSVKKTKVWKL